MNMEMFIVAVGHGNFGGDSAYITYTKS
jgi:hypothetical protein